MKIDTFNAIWIDVSDFIDWHGNFTGIQRVEYNLGTRLSKLPNVRFFNHNYLINSFIETDFSVIEQKAVMVSGEKPKSEQKTETQISIRHNLKHTVVGLLPVSSRARLVKIKRRIKAKGEKVSLAPRHPFADGDIIIVLGGNWTRSTYMPAIEKITKNTKVSLVHILYDFIPVMQPGFFPEGLETIFATYMKHVLKTANLTLAISDYTRRDGLIFAEQNNLKEPLIKTIRLGDDFVNIPPSKPPKIGKSIEDFIFCPGTFEIRKNHQLLYYSLKLAEAKRIKLPKIVIAGKRGWLSDSTRHLFNQDPTIKEEVIILHDCNDSEMAWLYQNCSFTIYPSFYEGWGLPIAESLNYGKPCIASNSSSMPEVGGKLVDYFSPYDSQECLNKIVEYLDQDTIKKRTTEIKKFYKSQTWDQCFSDVIRLIETSINT